MTAAPPRPTLTPRAAWALAAASAAFQRLRNSRGYTRCPEHGVDHTGKTARSIVIDCALHAHTNQPRYLEQAVATARLVTARLAPDAAAGGAWVFYPGLHHPRNTSTNIIDAGECVDALSTLLAHAGAALGSGDRQSIQQAVRLCADTYLTANVTGKPVVNQRLWGAMGLASAAAALDEPAWAAAARASVDGSLAEMRADGSFAYVRDAALLGEGAGIADLTVYYHSRCLAFARRALRLVGGEDHAEDRLRDGADFLALVLAPDGVKPLALEGKRWFWDAGAEVGSAPYDAYALAADGRPELRPLAGRAAAASAAALDGDGLIDAARGAPSFVCRVFHTADLAWLARAHAAAALDDLPAAPPGGGSTGARTAADAGVARLDAPHACLIVRTNKRPADALVGGRIGGGGLVYAGRRNDGWRNRLRHRPEPAAPEGDWLVRPAGAAAALAWGQQTSLRQARFQLHVARSHARAGRWRYAAALLWRRFGPPSWAAAAWRRSSHALASRLQPLDDGLRLHSTVAHPDGRTLAGVRTRRSYRLVDGAIDVRDDLDTTLPLAEARYLVPAAADDVQVQADGPWRRRGDSLHFGALAARAALSVAYRL